MKFKCPICGAINEAKDIPANPLLAMLDDEEDLAKCPECKEWTYLKDWEEIKE